MKEEEKKNKLITMILLAVASVLIVAVVGYDLMTWGGWFDKKSDRPILADSGMIQKIEKEKIVIKDSISGKEKNWQLVDSIKYRKLDINTSEYINATRNDLIPRVMVVASFANDEKRNSGLPDNITISPMVMNGEVLSVDDKLIKIKKEYLMGGIEEFSINIESQPKTFRLDRDGRFMFEVNASEIRIGDKITVYTDYMMNEGDLIPIRIEIMGQEV